MNDRARKTFEKHGYLIGQNLFDCHKERSQQMIRHMLATGETNAYTVTKGGINKLIFQTAWRSDGAIAGMAEIPIPLPADMPHYDRYKQRKMARGDRALFSNCQVVQIICRLQFFKLSLPANNNITDPMPRKAREKSSIDIYHVMMRGINHQVCS